MFTIAINSEPWVIILKKKSEKLMFVIRLVQPCTQQNGVFFRLCLFDGN